MSKSLVQPRSLGAAVLAIAIALCAVLLAPASSFAEPGPVALEVSPSPVVFARTTVGEKALAEVEIRNEGEAATIEKIAIEGGDAGDFSVGSDNCVSPSLPEGQKCTLTLEFKPGSSGAKQTTGVISFSPSRPAESFEITGTAVVPHLSFSPSSYDFGIVQTNSGSVQQGFQLENDGEAAVQVGNVELARYENFGFDFNPNNACSRLMQPGESCWFVVDFSPNHPGLYSEELRANAGGQSFSAELSGEGASPEVEVTPFPVDFGAATVGSTGSLQTLTITNSGKVPTGFFIAVISGGDVASFRLLDENCTGHELQPGSNCTAQVRFAPLAAGEQKAALSMFGDGEGGMQVPLRGEGVEPAVSISPAALDFGSQAKGTKSALRTFAFRNNGPTPVSLRTAMIVGPNLDQFLLGGDECTGVTLAAGQECLVRLRFSPATAGAKTAVLRIGSESGAFTVALSGLGTAPEKAAADSRSRRRRARFLRGASLSAHDARCAISRRCHPAPGHGRAQQRPVP